MEMGPGPLAALESAPIAVAMRQELWLYPIVEIVHITGFVVLVGSIVVLDLRLLGLNTSLSARQLSRHVLPWSVGAQWDRDAPPPARVKMHAAASLAIWISVIACGRLLAYV